MSGRHRQTRAGVARPALAGAVPALGAAGAATGLALSSGAAAPAPAAEQMVAPAAVATPAVRQDVPGRGGEAVSAVASAAARLDSVRAVGQRQSVIRLVEQVRADARAREAAAARQGRAELTAFRREQAEQQERDRRHQELRPWAGAQPESPGECDLEGLPRIGSVAGADEIVNRDCGLTDEGGHERSRDPWIDGQLLAEDD